MKSIFEHGQVVRIKKDFVICFECYQRPEVWPDALVKKGTLGIVDHNISAGQSGCVVHILGETWARFESAEDFWEVVDDPDLT